MADGKKVEGCGVGTGVFRGMNDQGTAVKVKLSEVYHVPTLAGSLLSVSKITDEGYEVVFNKTMCKVVKDDVIYLIGERRGSLYHLKAGPERVLVTVADHSQQCIHLWHRRLGHRNSDAIMRKVREEMGTGMAVQRCGVQSICGTCCEGKQSRASFPKDSESRTVAVGDLIHMDLCGPFEERTPSGNRFCLVIIDDYSRYTEVYLMRCKSEAILKIQQYVNLMANQFGRKPRIMRSDGGGEFINGKLQQFCHDNGIPTAHSRME